MSKHGKKKISKKEVFNYDLSVVLSEANADKLLDELIKFLDDKKIEFTVSQTKEVES